MVIGTVLSGRYRLDGRIATGGMGSVYEATDQRLERKVAVKLLKEGLAEDPRFIERFRREARAAGALSHPNIAAVFDFGSDDDRHFMVMELAHGRDLARVLREEGPLDPERSVLIGSQIAAALAHAHAAGVVHRDIKPPNVIVADGDRVKVTDFGIARAVGDATLTATGSVLGSAHYLSPEQAGGGDVGPPSDIYSLGIVLYEMLTGTVPFTGDSIIAVAMRHVSDEVPAPAELRADIPAELNDVVSRATAKDPHDRYPRATELETALTASLAPVGTLASGAEGAPTQPMGSTVWPIPGSTWDPQKLGRNVLLVLGALIVIAFVLLLMRLGDAEQPSAASDRQQEQQGEAPSDDETEEPPAETMTVPPEIVGEKLKDAEKLLEAAGFVVGDPQYVTSDEVDRDRVIWSDPEPGSLAPREDPVTLQVSAGEPDEDDDEGDEDHPGRGKAKGKKDD